MRIYLFFLLDAFIIFGLWELGFLEYMVKSDKTYISMVIIGIVYMSNFLFLAKSKTYMPDLYITIDEWIDYVIESLPALGLLGTVVGFIIMFTSLFGDVSGLSIDYIKNVMFPVLTSGIGTALVTTLVGMVGSLYVAFKNLVLK